jgi:NCS1 family nucleobase:cation symporter-1
MIGIQICDYWIVRRRRLQLSQLYTADRAGSYHYWRGLNWRTFVSWVVGWAPQLPGFIGTINPSIVVPVGAKHLYYLAFIVGFWISFLLYWALNTLSPPQGAGEMDPVDLYGTFTPWESERLGVELVIDAVAVDEKVDNVTVSQLALGKEV